MTNNKSKTIIILNPASGAGDGTGRKSEILAAVKNFKLSANLLETTKNISASTLAKRAVKNGAKHIIVGGGDGTVMEVVGEIVGKKIVMSIIPLGTGNIFAKNLEIPLDILQAFEVALKGRVMQMDVGRANGTYFGVNAGIGLDAEIMADTTRSLKDKYGMLAYFAIGIKKLTQKRGTYAVVIDGKKEKIYKAKSVMIANMEKTAGGVKVAPGARPASGRLKIGILKARSLPSWISVLFYALRGKIYKSNHYEQFSGSHIEITSLRGKKVYQCDGNTFPPTKKLEIDIIPSSLSVTCPNANETLQGKR